MSWFLIVLLAFGLFVGFVPVRQTPRPRYRKNGKRLHFLW